jgi:hypothetical protein
LLFHFKQRLGLRVGVREGEEGGPRHETPERQQAM